MLEEAFLFVKLKTLTSCIAGTGSGNFSINSTSGEIRTSQGSKFDRELESIYYLTMTATDIGGLLSTSHVIIVVDDDNDNRPQFNQTSFNAKVYENATIGDVIMKIIAYDIDTGSNGEVFYTLRGGEGKFYIDRSSGEIIFLNTW